MLTGSGSSAITSTAFKSVIDAVTAQISVTSVVEVLAYAVPVVIEEKEQSLHFPAFFVDEWVKPSEFDDIQKILEAF